MSMDTYLSHPVTDRKSWRAVRKRYDAAAPVRYPFWWTSRSALEGPRLPGGAAGQRLVRALLATPVVVGTEAVSYMFYDDPSSWRK